MIQFIVLLQQRLTDYDFIGHLPAPAIKQLLLLHGVKPLRSKRSNLLEVKGSPSIAEIQSLGMNRK